MGASETRLKVTPVILLNLARYYGGASVRTLQLAKMLQANNYPFTVGVLQGSPLHQRLTNDDLPVSPVNYRRGDFRIVLWLKKLINEKGCQVIDTHNPQSHLWGWLAAKLAGKCRVVTTVHGCYGEAEKGWRSRLYNAILRWNDNPNAHFIAVSKSVEHYLHKIGISQAVITYSPNAVSPGEANDRQVIIRQLADWSDDTLVIVIAARLEPVKGHQYLLRAFAIAHKMRPQLRLCIIGDGRLYEELRQLSSSLSIDDAVYFTGFRYDAPELLSSADIFCLSSLSEGLPFAVLEAAMAKLPLVLSNVGGMAEVFVHHQTALLFTAKDCKQLSQHFITLADAPEYCQQFGDRAYEWVNKNFSIQHMFAQTLHIYQGEGGHGNL